MDLTRVFSRHVAAPIGILLFAVGMADREAFYTPLGAALMLAGVAVLGAAALLADTATRVRDSSYPVLFVVLAIIAALAPFHPGSAGYLVPGLTIAAAVAFYALGLRPGLRRFRLPVSLACLVLAHAAYINLVGIPQHEDVYRFLNGGVDALAHGVDPYGDIPARFDGPFKFTYPPGVLLLVAPFRLLLGDIRWAYIVAEPMAVLGMAACLRRFGPPPDLRPQAGDGTVAARTLDRWQEALLLIPLALPRASQAFYIFSNHEWLLVALAVVALLLAVRGSWVGAGLVLGVGIASKQYFLVFPAVFLLPAVRPRSLAVGVAVAAAIALPFVLWNPAIFLVDVLGNLNNAPDPARLTVWAVLANAGLDTGVTGARLLALLGLAAVAFLWWRSRRDLATSLRACGIALMLFTLAASFAAYNYYVYALVFYTWGLMLPAGWPEPARARVPLPA